jgi:hypothetical protein
VQFGDISGVQIAVAIIVPVKPDFSLLGRVVVCE